MEQTQDGHMTIAQDCQEQFLNEEPVVIYIVATSNLKENNQQYL